MKLLTMSETANILNISLTRCYDLARQNLLPIIHLGRQLRVDPDILTNWLSNGGQPLPGGWKREK